MPAGVITRVAPRSLAQRLGLQPGDELLAVNGHSPRDVIDVQFYSAEEEVTLTLRRAGQEMTRQARRRYNEPLGLDFARPTFDVDIRRCNNHCDFCFVAQMPPGLRSSLYVKDDDYRHSFLFGNYVTLTNLDESDWARIEEQFLSPLYVSVQATDPDLRRHLLGNPAAPDVMAQLERLARLGIEVHTQLVLIPGLNDGAHLDRSIGDLAALYPAVRSVSVVPVGLTRFHRGGCRKQTLAEARATFEQVSGWQERLLAQLGVRFAYLSDEWYLRLGEPPPPLEAYDGLDLTENGVGLASRFLAGRVWRSLPQPATLVTGTLFAPLLRQVTAGMKKVQVISIINRFFGETVTVAGLLTAQDVIEQLTGQELVGTVILPAVMFRGPEGQSLDEKQPSDIATALGRPIITADTLHPCTLANLQT